jgi:hypothetical protein
MEKIEKKLSENIYIVSLLTGYLVRVLTLFRSLKKFFSKMTENVLILYKNVKCAKISEKTEH